MRVTREKAAENRERIVATAARLFRENGFDGIGLDAIMRESGLTHGGFYRHFRSKDDLAVEALAVGLGASAAREAALGSLEDFVASYLSPRHRDNPGSGCMMAALGGDIARQESGARAVLTAHLQDRIARWTGAGLPRETALAAIAGMVGALEMSRAVNDPGLSDEILASARQVYGGMLARGTAS